MTAVELALLHPADHRATAEALGQRLRRRRPGLQVRLTPQPLPGHDAAALGRPAVVVPLGSSPFDDLPDGPLAGLVVAPLAGHPLLEAAAERRLREAGVWPGDPAVAVVLTDRTGTGHVDVVARRWSSQGWCAVRAAGAGPDGVLAAVHELRRGGADRVAVARLDVVGDRLPGLPREVAAAAPLGSCEEVARAVLARFDAALPALPHVAA